MASDGLRIGYDDYLLKPAARGSGAPQRQRVQPGQFNLTSTCHNLIVMSPPSIPARGLLALIQLYKWTLSPLVGNACRYQPTCSSYAADCVRRHGAWAGSWMALARLCRCAPWGRQGFDPAPLTIKTNSWWRPWRYGDWRGPQTPQEQNR